LFARRNKEKDCDTAWIPSGIEINLPISSVRICHNRHFPIILLQTVGPRSENCFIPDLHGPTVMKQTLLSVMRGRMTITRLQLRKIASFIEVISIST
jgi:hypothetical protein